MGMKLDPKLADRVVSMATGTPLTVRLPRLLEQNRPDFVARVTHRPQRGVMNRTETAYAELLEARRRAGEVLWFEFEAFTLRLARRTHYRPDFPVLTPTGLQFHEVKGFMRDDAWLKLKLAARAFPFQFIVVRRTKGDWSFQEVEV
jgi:hypothetical protein